MSALVSHVRGAVQSALLVHAVLVSRDISTSSARSGHCGSAGGSVVEVDVVVVLVVEVVVDVVVVTTGAEVSTSPAKSCAPWEVSASTQAASPNWVSAQESRGARLAVSQPAATVFCASSCLASM